MSCETDLSLRVVVPRLWAEVVGAVLMPRLGCYAEEPLVGAAGATDRVVLVFYPAEPEPPSDAELLALLPEELRAGDLVAVERQAVSRDWVEGWKDHFQPIVVGRVRVRPTWEPALCAPPGAAGDAALVDVVINPGLAFGTGLHPTTRGPLTLLQEEGFAGHTPVRSLGALVDVGTGSGILAIAAAKLGWAPIIAFDDDPVALVSAQENVAANGVVDAIRLLECGVAEASLPWFAGVTVLANMTLDPVSTLVRRLAHARPCRLVVAGILAGAQEEGLVGEAERCGFKVARRLYEAEWVCIELLPNGVSAPSPGRPAAVGEGE